MKMNIKTNNSGIALILVLGILAVLAVLATTFAFNMRLEQKAARNYLDAVSADCIAKAGVEHAIALLHNDLTGSTAAYDWNVDTWGYLDDGDSIFGAYTSGGNYYHEDLDSYEHTCTPGYNGTDAQWKGIWQDGILTGRYAVLVLDESGKMNINTAGNIAHPTTGDHVSNEGWTTAEIDLEALSGFSGLEGDIVKYRYGGGATPSPGSSGDDDENSEAILEWDGIDNDGDGSTDEPGEGDDEPDEFTPWYPRGGGDTAFSTIREIRFVPGVTTVWDSVKNLITVHSRTRNQYWDSGWEPKLNINAVADVSELSTLLNNAPDGGVPNPKQKACNIMDYKDSNINISALYNAATATWIYGVEPILINEVLGRSYRDEPGLPWTNISGTWESRNFGPFAPNTCYKIRTTTGDCGTIPPPKTLEVKVNDGGPEEIGSLSFIDYGETVRANRFACRSDSSGFITIESKDLMGAANCVIDKIEFVCCEFIELYNASNDPHYPGGISIKDFVINTGSDNTITDAVYYDISSGARLIDPDPTISPNGYFVITNDEELFAYSYGNKTNDLGVWGDDWDETVPVAVIAGWSAGYADNPGELAETGNVDILLRDGDGFYIDRACSYTGRYGNSTTIGVSREKDDPTFRSSWTHDSTKQATALYDNEAYKSGSHTLSDLDIKNHHFASIGEMSDSSNVSPNFYKGVASGIAWTAILGDSKLDDLGKIAERITVDAVRLDAETATTDAGTVGNYWNAATSGPYLTKSCVSSFGSSDTSYWDWQKARLQPVQHTLYIYGLYTNDTDTGYLKVYVADDYSTTPPGFPGLPIPGGDKVEFKPSDGLKIGTIGTGNIGSDGRFAIKLETDGTKTGNGDVYFDYLLLVPQSSSGRINVNTAALQVLKALPGLSAAQAEAIYNNVHSSPEVPYKKLGDVLDATGIDAAQFSAISNLISVHSDVFKIICLAQTIQDMDPSTYYVDDPSKVVLAEKKVEVIVDRSALPSGPIRILSWKEITE